MRITSGLASGSLTNNPTPGFKFSSSYPGATFRCRIDHPGGAFAVCASPFQPVTPLADGDHTFTVKAVSGPDQSQPVSRSFTVDTKAPAVSVSSGPRDGSASRNRRPSFSFNSNEQGSRFQCRLDSSGFRPCTSPHATRRLHDGGHVFRVRAIDAANNKSAPRRIKFRVDTAAPRLRIKGSDTVKTRRRRASAVFRLRTSQHVGLKCRLASTGFEPCSRRYRTPKLGRGAHALEVKATDRAGNSAVRHKQFRIVERPAS